MQKSRFVASFADSARMEGNLSIQDYSEPKGGRKASASDALDYVTAAQPDADPNNHPMSMRDMKRREFMRIDYNNNFDLGKSLNPPSFREHANASMTKVTEKAMGNSPGQSPNRKSSFAKSPQNRLHNK